MIRQPTQESVIRSRRMLLLAGVLALIAIIVILVATRWGIGVSPDSISYIGGARNMLEGNGYSMLDESFVSRPITHFPPLYPIVLAAIGVVGVDPLVGARWLAAAVFGANVLVVGWLLTRIASGDRLSSWAVVPVGAFLTLTSVTMLEIHAMAWTEPAFILLGLVGLLLLARTLRSENYLLLTVSALLFGLSFVTRYAGVAYIATGSIALILFGNRSIRTRMFKTALFGLTSLLLPLAWVVRNLTTAETATNRTLYLHAPSVNHLWELLSTFSAWLLVPNSWPALVRAGILLAAAIALLFAFFWSRHRREDAAAAGVGGMDVLYRRDVVLLLLLFVPVYLAVLLFSNTFLRAYTPLDGRILSPLFITFLAVALYIIEELLQAVPSNRALKAVLAIGGVLFLALHLFQGASYVRAASNDGLGFNSRFWHDSETIRELARLPEASIIYSNAPEAIYIHTGRAAHPLPRRVESGTQLANDEYDREMATISRELDEGKSVIVFFDLEWRRASSEKADLTEVLRLEPLTSAADGTIFVGRGGWKGNRDAGADANTGALSGAGPCTVRSKGMFPLVSLSLTRQSQANRK